MADDLAALRALVWEVLTADRSTCTVQWSPLHFREGHLVYHRGDRLDVHGCPSPQRLLASVASDGDRSASGTVIQHFTTWPPVDPLPATAAAAAAHPSVTPMVAAVMAASDGGCGERFESPLAAASIATALECERDFPRHGWTLAHLQAFHGTLGVPATGDVTTLAAVVAAGQGTTLLMAAVLGGQSRLVDDLVAGLPANALNAVDAGGRTALWHAVSVGDVRCLKSLLMHPGVDPDLADAAGVSPLALAATRPDVPADLRYKLIELLLCAGAAVFDGFADAAEVAGLPAATVSMLMVAAGDDDLDDGGAGGDSTVPATVPLREHDETVTLPRPREATVAGVADVTLASAAQPKGLVALIERLRADPGFSFVSPSQVSVGRLLGVGGFGRVHLAALHGAAVVVKTVGEMTSRAAEDEFLGEVAALVAVSHPNALEYVGVTVVGAAVAIVTEYMDGGDLMDRIERTVAGGFPLVDRISILAQV